MKKACILVIDDEQIMQEVLSDLLSKAGFEVKIQERGAAGLAMISEREFDLVLLDLMLPGENGLDILTSIKQTRPDQMVVMITAHATLETGIQAMKQGAFDYVVKPFKNEALLHTIRRALEHRKLAAENRMLRRSLGRKYSYHSIVGQSQAMLRVFDLIEQVAPTMSTVLIEGESGTGKELFARAIHEKSERSDGPFVSVNSGSMPPDLLESNLFGHVKGAFTGAVTSKKGLMEVADGGSIFFDEIATVHIETQAKLLRVLQEREFMQLGGVNSIRVNVRIIAATNSDLLAAVKERRFREDLYYRINVIRVKLPPLRERRSDIPLLVEHFIKRSAEENEKPQPSVSADAMKSLCEFHWPGNVRQLENVIEKAVVLCRSAKITADQIEEDLTQGLEHARSHIQVTEKGLPFRLAVEEFEKDLIVQSLRVSKGVQKKAAGLLGLKPSTLNEMIKRYKIAVKETR